MDILTLQWTALFATQMLAALGDAGMIALGALLAAGALVPTGPGIVRRLLRWGSRLVIVIVAILLLLAYVVAAQTGDAVLAAQLRTGIVETALLMLIGAGIAGIVGLLWSMRAQRTAQDLEGQGL
ncbi:MAG: hypothetical protein WC809_05360 [Sinimarinibacterium sp.]|jgi:hypothetical protein